MNKWRYSKRGFTLIKIMVMITMIAVLALLGLRLYTARQQQKAKNAVVEVLKSAENFNTVVRLNCETIQTIILGELIDSDYETVKAYVSDSGRDGLFIKSGIRIPGDGAQTKNGDTQRGWVVVSFDDALKVFSINGNAFVTGSVFTEPLTVRY